MKDAPLTPDELRTVLRSPARQDERRRKQATKDARRMARKREKFGVQVA